MTVSRKTLKRWLTQCSHRTELVRKYMAKCPDSSVADATAILTKLSDDFTPQLIRGVYYREKDRVERKAKKAAKIALVCNLNAEYPDATRVDLAKMLKGKANDGFIARTLAAKKVEIKSPRKAVPLVSSPFDKLQIAKQFIETIGGLDQAIKLLQTIKEINETLKD